jgi:ribosomal protein L30/L7E
VCKVSRYGIHLLEINRINAEQFFEGLIIISGILAVVKYLVKTRRKP